MLADTIMVVFMQTNVDKDQVKAAIKAQQDQQIDNASVFFYIIMQNIWI